MKIEGIQGESTDRKHQGWIDLLSVNWSSSSPVTTPRGNRPKQRPRAGDSGFLLDYLSDALDSVARVRGKTHGDGHGSQDPKTCIPLTNHKPFAVYWGSKRTS